MENISLRLTYWGLKDAHIIFDEHSEFLGFDFMKLLAFDGVRGKPWLDQGSLNSDLANSNKTHDKKGRSDNF